jgi:hypothetical protein
VWDWKPQRHYGTTKNKIDPQIASTSQIGLISLRSHWLGSIFRRLSVFEALLVELGRYEKDLTCGAKAMRWQVWVPLKAGK